MNTVWVLTSRCDTTLGMPYVALTHEKIYQQMKSEYEEWVKHGTEGNYGFGYDSAWVDTGNQYVEWEISECEVE